MAKMNNLFVRFGFPQESGRLLLPRLKLCLAAMFCLLIAFAASAANFTASLDRDTIALGETATLSLSFQGGQPDNVPTPQVPGLSFANTGNSQNFSFNNGQMSSVVTVTLAISPQQTGQFIIPAMEATVGGQHLVTQPLRLLVTQPSAPTPAAIQSGSQPAFMRFDLPQRRVYPGESLTGQLQIFLRDDVQNAQNFQINSQPADGLIMGQMTEGHNERTQIGNRTYRVVPFSVKLTVSKTGTVSVGPISAGIVIVTGAQSGWFPGELFGGQQQQVSLVADQVTIQSLPLPTENVPASFNGAIGVYSMAFSAGPTNVAIGDPITVRVQISGTGALDSITLPSQPGWQNFKMVSPTSKIQYSDDAQDGGTKTFEEFAMPQNANLRELPPFSFSFFNPIDGNYHTITQPATPLVVTSVGATPLPTITGTKSASENQAPQDIVSIRQNLGALAQGRTPLVMRPAFLALQSVPVIAFIAALVWRKRTDSLANNPRLRRQRAVAQLIAGGMDDLKKFAAENKSNEFFAMLFRLLQEQLGERLDCPAISITEADVDERLIALGAKPETLNSLRELFQACNQARYAPIQTSQELSALAEKFKKTVGELQSLKA